MNDDLNTSAALAVVHDTIREGNTALAAGDEAGIRGALTAVRAMLGVLGLDPLDAGVELPARPRATSSRSSTRWSSSRSSSGRRRVHARDWSAATRSVIN
jgi:cysteinyl-tRNA synthetase